MFGLNSIINKFNKHRTTNKIHLEPLTSPFEVEIYGDSAFRQDNQQGIVTVFREKGSPLRNLIAWKSQKSDRKAWSTLAAETHVMQHAIDKAAGMKIFLAEMGVSVAATRVLTDNLSLKKVLYSGKTTLEMRLRREMAVIRDLFVTEDIEIRHVDTQHMIADDHTKKTTGQLIREVAIDNNLPGHTEYDLEGNEPGDMTQADIDIPTFNEDDQMMVPRQRDTIVHDSPLQEQTDTPSRTIQTRNKPVLSEPRRTNLARMNTGGRAPRRAIRRLI